MAWGFIVSTQLRINRMAEWESDKTRIFIGTNRELPAYTKVDFLCLTGGI